MAFLSCEHVPVEEVSGSGIIKLAVPLKVHELVSTVDMLSQGIVRRRKRRREKPVIRSEKEAAVIETAKQLLITRNNMTEEEAHRYLQKRSMDNGTDMVETAQMVLALK